MGDCHHIAIALHRLKNLPIVFFYGERCSDGFSEYIMIHCGVDNDGFFEDFAGIHGDHED